MINDNAYTKIKAWKERTMQAKHVLKRDEIRGGLALELELDWADDGSNDCTCHFCQPNGRWEIN